MQRFQAQAASELTRLEANAFLAGFEHKTQTTEGTCNEHICAHLILNYKRSDFYEQIQNSPFQNS